MTGRTKSFKFIFPFPLFVLIHMVVSGQDVQPSSHRVFVGIEPSSVLLGEYGGYLDYSFNENKILGIYFGWHNWPWNNSGEVSQTEIPGYSDYILAAHGPVGRLGLSIKTGENIYKFSANYFKFEFTYKYLSYDHVWFVDGSKGLNGSAREVRSMTAHFVGINLLFQGRQFQSSYLNIPFDWFIGPHFGLGFNDYTIHYPFKPYQEASGPEINTKKTDTKFVFGIRVGVRLGFKIYDAENHPR